MKEEGPKEGNGGECDFTSGRHNMCNYVTIMSNTPVGSILVSPIKIEEKGIWKFRSVNGTG